MTLHGTKTRSTGTMRHTGPQGTCKACGAGCCCCCANWCATCNMRKCRAHRDLAYAEGTLNTEYRREYPEKHAPHDLVRRKDDLLPSAPFRGVTTHAADFVPLRGNRAQSARDKGVGPWPERPFNATTTYTAEYIKRPFANTLPPGKAADNWSSPFVGLSMYRQEFVPKTAVPQPRNRDGGPSLSVPFDGTSEYREEFHRHPHHPHPARPGAELLPSRHVGNITEYGKEYMPKEFQRRPAKPCCDDARHPATHVKLTPCKERPWTACTSCAGGSRPGTARPASAPRTRSRPATATATVTAGMRTNLSA